MCILPSLRYHNLLKEDIENLPQNLDFFITYQQMDNLYTLFKYRSTDEELQRRPKVWYCAQKQFTQTKSHRSAETVYIAKKMIKLAPVGKNYPKLMETRGMLQTQVVFVVAFF